MRIGTLGVAYLTFEENIKGSLTAGKFADLVILSHDIMTVPENQIMNSRVLATMVGGTFVYDVAKMVAQNR